MLEISEENEVYVPEGVGATRVRSLAVVHYRQELRYGRVAVNIDHANLVDEEDLERH